MTRPLPENRKRKTKDPCPGCYLHKARCMCSEIPVLNLKTKISLVIHTKELKRTTNTGRLAIKALSNSEMRVRGEGNDTLDLSNLINSNYETFLFYPTENAIELSEHFKNDYIKPIHLIVPDGNWRQASKVHTRHHELKDIPRVKISTPNMAKLHLRKESFESGMATLEAIAHALGFIEGENVKNELMKVYWKKLEQTFIGRGLIKIIKK